MLDLPNVVLKNGYTITIGKTQNILRGSYIKRFSDGLHAYELPSEDLESLHQFPSIIESLSQSQILQVSMPTYLMCGIIGEKKTEGPYCENEYLEVHEQQLACNYYELLSKLDKEISKSKQDGASVPKQYKKLYKGESRYE